jgi:hypothetical protein
MASWVRREREHSARRARPFAELLWLGFFRQFAEEASNMLALPNDPPSELWRATLKNVGALAL